MSDYYPPRCSFVHTNTPCSDGPYIKCGEFWNCAHHYARFKGLPSSTDRAAGIEEGRRQMREAVGAVLAEHGCDCDCDHHREEHGDDCERCLGCRISAAMEKEVE